MRFLKFLSRERIPFQTPRWIRSGWTEPPADALRWLRFVPITGEEVLKAAQKRLARAIHHMDYCLCRTSNCPTHALFLIDRSGNEVLLGAVCARCGLLDVELPSGHAFESWNPFAFWERHHAGNLRDLIAQHPANFRAWSTYVAPPPTPTPIYR